MNKNELNSFNKLWVGIYETYGKTLTTTTIAIFFDVLKDYSYEQVRDGLKAHIANPNGGSFVPRPSDIIRNLQSNLDDGHVCADLAWSMIPMNEHDSYVVTNEIMEAWGQVKPLIDSGDNTAARMAFRPAYDEIVRRSRLNPERVKWIATLGENDNGRKLAQEVAREKNNGMPNIKARLEKQERETFKLKDNSKFKKASEVKTKTLIECMEYLNIKEPVKYHISAQEKKAKSEVEKTRLKIIEQAGISQ